MFFSNMQNIKPTLAVFVIRRIFIVVRKWPNIELMFWPYGHTEATSTFKNAF